MHERDGTAAHPVDSRGFDWLDHTGEYTLQSTATTIYLEKNNGGDCVWGMWVYRSIIPTFCCRGMLLFLRVMCRFLLFAFAGEWKDISSHLFQTCELMF